jgi:hypothetical protein
MVVRSPGREDEDLCRQVIRGFHAMMARDHGTAGSWMRSKSPLSFPIRKRANARMFQVQREGDVFAWRIRY